jgi:integrase
MSAADGYVVHVARFQSGERFPILLCRGTLQPVVLATRYILDECRESSQANTLLRNVRVLKWFYEWCDGTGVELESRLRRARLFNAGEITGFCRYLRARRTSEPMASANRAQQEVVSTLSPATFNFYLGVVERFLIWAAYEFFPVAMPGRNIRESVETGRERIQRAFRSNKLGGRAVRVRLGLTEQEVAELREVVKPEGRRNPFKPAVRFRNYVIVELMLATGLRRGEVLKVKLSHLPRGPKQTLTVQRAPDDKDDTRRNEPAVKTREREIPIAKSLAVDLWRYAQKHRKTGKHSYLFTSQRGGVPLDVAGINWIFSSLVRQCFPHLRGKLHPHNIRHTFNNRLLEKARDLGWSDDQQQKVQTYLNGWAEGSIMPEIYTRAVIEAQAMELAEKYQADLYRS